MCPLGWNRLILADSLSVIQHHQRRRRLPSGLEDEIDCRWLRLAATAARSAIWGEESALIQAFGRSGVELRPDGLGNLDIQPALASRRGLPAWVIFTRDLALVSYRSS